ncbi:carboxypeptidase y, partial [Colletotrichum incanum]
LHEDFPLLKHVDLDLSGKSFAGRYVPNFADRILKYNAFVDQAPDSSGVISLRSIVVGNPWTNPAV